MVKNPNGTGAPTNNTNPTPEKENSPPPTPTPTDTPAPTDKPDEPEQDSEPDPTEKPSPTKSPTPTKKVTPTKSPTKTPTPTSFNVDIQNTSGGDVNVDGLRDKLGGEVLGSGSGGESGFPLAPFLFIGSGICFVTASGYLIQKKRREDKDDATLKK